MSINWLISTFEKPKKYDNLDFAKAVFEYIVNDICPHGHKWQKLCDKCYKRKYNKGYKQSTKAMRNKELRDQYHEQHPQAKYYKPRKNIFELFNK